MKRTTLKNVLLVVLLISNSILLFMWINAPERKHHGPRDEIIAKLGFSEKQITQYDLYIQEHRKSIRSLEKRLSAKKKVLFQDVNQPFSERIADEISSIEKDILRVHYNHIKEIESLCKDNQKAKFETLNKEIGELFNPRPPKHE